MNEVYNEDCMIGMARYPDKYFELAIVDPPYGINADDKNSAREMKSKKSAYVSKDYGSQQWDSYTPNDDYFNELIRVSKDQIIWGVNYYDFNLKGGRIYWDKCVTMPTYSDGELAYCSKTNSLKSFKFAWHGMIQGDMKTKEIRIHPTQKPVKLYEWLLMNYAKEGDKILDTHLGSGSSRIAAYKLGFDFTGFELDKEYFETSEKRFKEVTSQLTIF
jgi:site-specific DNA-methyltransferase (adenine-specific)